MRISNGNKFQVPDWAVGAFVIAILLLVAAAILLSALQPSFGDMVLWNIPVR